MIDEKAKPKRNAPPAGKDLLASYMEQLSHIPLCTPEQIRAYRIADKQQRQDRLAENEPSAELEKAPAVDQARLHLESAEVHDRSRTEVPGERAPRARQASR